MWMHNYYICVDRKQNYSATTFRNIDPPPPGVPYKLTTFRMSICEACLLLRSRTKPKFAGQFAKSFLVVGPVAIEVDGAVLSSLEHLHKEHAEVDISLIKDTRLKQYFFRGSPQKQFFFVCSLL